MNPKPWGGWWTEAKLGILRKYLAAFNNAAKTMPGTVYLDLFGGKLVNTRPDTGTTYTGSAGVAMETTPPFSRLVFWELGSTADRLRSDLTHSYPGDHRWHVVAGDCNASLDEGLRFVERDRRAPTFAFIDPKGLDVAWTTLQRLSSWRIGKTKTEMWILLPEPAMERVLGLRGLPGRRTADKLTRLYGGESWVAIHELRRCGELSADEARAEYVNLLRWRLQKDLGYARTLPLSLTNVSDQPVYTMVFATDHPVGREIMQDIYGYAGVHEIPTLLGRAQAHRKTKRADDAGRPTLFEVEPTIRPRHYEHVEPWEPPRRVSGELVLDDEDEEDDDYEM